MQNTNATAVMIMMQMCLLESETSECEWKPIRVPGRIQFSGTDSKKNGTNPKERMEKSFTNLRFS